MPKFLEAELKKEPAKGSAMEKKHEAHELLAAKLSRKKKGK